MINLLNERMELLLNIFCVVIFVLAAIIYMINRFYSEAFDCLDQIDFIQIKILI